ncbi:MAG: hypothetical protein MR378_04370 [Ruminococcus sp.]|nr:hypothetical protein [Ruminococcus sp.]
MNTLLYVGMWEWAVNYEPQVTAVELAQLGEGDSPKSSVSHETKQELFLGKTVCNIRQKGVPPLLLPASVLQLPRCLVRICNVDSHDLMLFELDSFKNCNCSRKNLLQIQFASQMWAARPHLANIFKKLLDQKTFYLPAARIFEPTSKSV